MNENIVLDRVTKEKEINYDNAPDVSAGMEYMLCDTEIKDGCNLRKTCKGCCPPIGICNKPWVN